MNMRPVLCLLATAALLNGCGASPGAGTSPTTASVTTVISGSASAARQTLYVPEFETNSVTTYGTNGKAGLTITQGLDGPFGVAVDGNGKIYVTNVHTGEVTTYLPDGTQTTPTISGIQLPWGIAVGTHGKIYVVSEEPGSCTYGTLRSYTPEGLPTTPTIKIPGEPVGVAVDAHGKIYVANVCAGPSGQGSVMTYKPNGSPATPYLTDSDGIDEPYGLTIVGDKLYVANSFGSYDHSFAGYITTYTLDGKEIAPTIGQGVNGALSVAVDGSGKIFVLNAYAAKNGDITSFLPNGSPTKPTITKGIDEANLIAIH